jgi:hypothetical protein
MGYHMLITTTDGRRWWAARGIRYTPENGTPMYYTSPSAAARAREAFVRRYKNHGTMKPRSFDLVRVRDNVTVSWSSNP